MAPALSLSSRLLFGGQDQQSNTMNPAQNSASDEPRILHRERTPYFNRLSLNKAATFSHQVHGSGSSVAYLQYRRGTPTTTEVAEVLELCHMRS
ncbi:hypothetical protein CDAR_41531 [Caerostris darwini]|uniref:Uncharacterized protein n=1 Tax=Caerostris darwini TaxID=1538125 RepID=A0AAV4W4E2_9ARAC|nr:hypothetical protein CDAR_41531 [Caerostris darwini]